MSGADCMKLIRAWQETYHAHPDPRLQRCWNILQVSLLLLPINGFLGTVGTLLAALTVWKQRFRDLAQSPIAKGFLLLGLVMIISSLVAHHRLTALLGLANFLPFFIVFPALCELLQVPAQLRRLAWILVIGSVPVVVIGLGQLFWGWAAEIRVLGVLVDIEIDAKGNPWGRMASTFFYANVLAIYLTITFTLNLGLWIEAWESRRHPSSPMAKPWPDATKGVDRLAPPYPLTHRLFLSVALAGNAVALVLTNSRNAWAIALLVCLALAIYKSWRWLMVLLGVIAGSVLGAAFAPSPIGEGLRMVVPAFFWARITDDLYPDRPTATLRVTLWKFAWDLAQQRPWLGWGLNNFSPLYQEQMHIFRGHPHNLLLMLAAETGIPAMLMMLGLVGWIVYRGVKHLMHWQVSTRPTFPGPLRLSPADASPSPSYRPIPTAITNDRLIYFTYLVAFLACTVFSLSDVTLFDVRINILGWLLLAAIAGVVNHATAVQESLTRE